MNQKHRKPKNNSAPTVATTTTAKEEEVVMREFDLLTGDSTKAHGRGGKKNEVNVILGKDHETGEKKLLRLDVNKTWAQTTSQFKGKAEVTVSNNEPALRKALLEKSDEYQSCILHCIRDIKFYLWQAKLSVDQRKPISMRVERVLWALRNLVEKHIFDGGVKVLRWRVDWALSELKKISSELFLAGLDSVGRFVCNAANHMVTFARLAIKGVVVPFSNNLIERLMGEIAKRVKHKWMHWSERGLENLLNILLIRYCNKRIYKELKEKYLKPNNNTLITVKIT